jgi:hypothetical protein
LVSFVDLINAMTDALQRVPELVAALNGDPANIIPYIDRNPLSLSIANATYTQKPGTVMVSWKETAFRHAEMTAWVHTNEIVVRAQRDVSPLDIIQLIVNGVPVPGDGQRWRICPLMPGVNATDVLGIARTQDTELIDYFVITTETTETGDF